MTTIRLQSVPLHTERPDWAAHAPGQVKAACKRGGHVIGLTETRGPIMNDVKQVVERNGYVWYGSPLDAHRNVTLLVRKGLRVVHHEAVVVHNNYRVGVTVELFGHHVTVFEMHWEPTDAGHKAQTASLVEAMTAASRGHDLAFYMGDSNPSKPQRAHGSEPNALLAHAQMPVVWDELRRYPPGLGVNVIGRNLADTRVEARRAVLHLARGSDHRPATAVYAVRAQ